MNNSSTSFQSPSFTANYYMGLSDEQAIKQLNEMGIKFEPNVQKSASAISSSQN